MPGQKRRRSTDRRKSGRITLEDLNRFGAEALKKRFAEVTKPPDRRPGYMKVLDILDVPRNTIANMLANISGVDKSKMERATGGQKRVPFSALLAKMGVKKGAARSVAGLVGDVAIDPLTYLSFGATAGTKLAQHLPRVLRSAKTMLKTARRTGKFSEDLVRAIGKKAAGRYGRAFQAIAKKKGLSAARGAMMGRRGGSRVVKRLVKAAERGDKGALEFFAKHGEKGRSLFRIPGMETGFPILKFGARARKYKAVVKGITDPSAIRELSALTKAVRVGRVVELSKLAYESATKGDLDGASKYIKLLRPKLAQFQKQYSLLRKAQASGVRQGVVEGVKRAPLRTSAVRKTGRQLDIAEGMLRRTEERLGQAKIPGQLAGKFEVTAGGRAALERAAGRVPTGQLRGQQGIQALRRAEMKAARKAAPKLTTYPKELQTIRTPLKLTETELAAATAAQRRLRPQLKAAIAGKEASQQAVKTAKQELMAFKTGPKAPAVMQEKMRATLGPRYLRGAQKGILPKLHQLRRTWFGAPRGPIKQQMVGIEAQYGPRAAGMGARTAAATARELEPLIAQLATDPKVLAQFPGGADEIRRVLQSLAQKGRFAEGEALQGIFLRAQRAGIIGAGGEIADPKIAAALARAAPEGFLSHILTPEAREAITRHGKMTAEREGKTRAMRLTAPRPEAIARTKAIHLRAPDGSITKMLDTPEAAAKIAGLKAEGYQVVGKFDISTAEWNRMAASEGGLSQLTGPQYEGLAKFKGPLFEEDLARTAGQRVTRGVQTDASKQFVDLVSPYGVDVPRGTQHLEKYAHLAPVNRPVEGNPFKVLEQTGIFNRQYPVQVADQINDMIKVYDQPEVIKSLLHYTDMGLGIWKSFQLYHPAYFIRNVWQNFFGGIMAGARPSVVARLGWSSEGKLLRKALDVGDPNILGNASILLAGRQAPLRALYDDALRVHLTGGGRTAQQMPTRMAGEAGTVAAAKALEGGRKTVTGAIFKINTWFEDTQKLGTWMNFIDDGMDAQSAALRTMTAMPDLSDLTRFEKGTMRRLIPFWSWMRKNGALQIFHFLPRKPAYANLMPKLKEFAEGFRGKDNVPEELRAEWMREQMAWQVAGTAEEGTAFLPSTWFPFEEAYAAGTMAVQPGEGLRRLYTGMRPELRFGAELATGYSAFRKQEYPLGSDITTGQLAKAVPKAIMGKSGTQMDVLLGLRPAREWLPGGRVSEMRGPQAQAQRMVLGGALQPMDAERGRAARDYQLRKEIQTVRAQINRALQAGDQSLADNLTRKWVQLMAERRSLGLSVPKATGAMMEKLAVPAGMGQ